MMGQAGAFSSAHSPLLRSKRGRARQCIIPAQIYPCRSDEIEHRPEDCKRSAAGHTPA